MAIRTSWATGSYMRLLEQFLDHRFHGGLGDLQFRCDFFIGQSIENAAKDRVVRGMIQTAE